jgi:O-antigen/teichoic acid export membrane protein
LLVLRAFATPVAERIGPFAAMAWLMLCAVVLQSSNVDTAVVRFGKTEPFLLNSIVGAALVTLANWLLAPLGIVWVFAGFAAAMSLVVVPWVHIIAGRQLAKPRPR